MTLRFDGLHWPDWHPHVSRAMSVVLAVIAVSALFGALRVVDGAVSGSLAEVRPAASVPRPEAVLLREPPSAGTVQPEAPEDAGLVDVPPASADAVSL